MPFVPTQIQHNYTLGLDVYNISVNVTNDVTPEPINVSRWIDVQEIILNISFVAKAIGTIDTTQYLYLNPDVVINSLLLRYSFRFSHH